MISRTQLGIVCGNSTIVSHLVYIQAINDTNFSPTQYIDTVHNIYYFCCSDFHSYITLIYSYILSTRLI